jgi:hypothetical protein
MSEAACATLVRTDNEAIIPKVQAAISFLIIFQSSRILNSFPIENCVNSKPINMIQVAKKRSIFLFEETNNLKEKYPKWLNYPLY